MGKVSTYLIVILSAIYIVFDVNAFYADLHPLAKLYLYDFFHGNIFHLATNCLAIMFVYARTNAKELLCSYALATVTILIAPHNYVIGFSNFIYATIGLRTPPFKHPWWRSSNTIAFLLATLIMLFIPKVSGLTHIIAFSLGVLASYGERKRNKTFTDYGKAKGK